VYELVYSIAALDRFGKYRLSSLMIDDKVIFRPSREGGAGDVIDSVDIFERRIPVGRTVEAAVCKLDQGMLEVSQLAGVSHQTSDRITPFDQLIDEMAADKAASAGYQHFFRIARFAHMDSVGIDRER
jgi:hypothetical protein